MAVGGLRSIVSFWCWMSHHQIRPPTADKRTVGRSVGRNEIRYRVGPDRRGRRMVRERAWVCECWCDSVQFLETGSMYSWLLHCFCTLLQQYISRQYCECMVHQHKLKFANTHKYEYMYM